MALHEIDLKQLGVSIQMVGAVYADKDRAYLVLLPGESSRPVKEVKLDQEEWLKVMQQTDLVEVEALVRDPETKQVVKALVRKSERQISQQVSWTVFRRDEFKCRYCGAADVPLTVDHLITWESGGMSVPENLVACCRKCNGARGETPYADWLMDSYYKRVSQNLDYQGRFANQALVPTLAGLPVSIKMGKRSR